MCKAEHRKGIYWFYTIEDHNSKCDIKHILFVMKMKKKKKEDNIFAVFIIKKRDIFQVYIVIDAR